MHKAIYSKPGVSEKTRQKILKITNDLHYSVNATASRLKRGMLNIAVVLPLLPHECNQFFRKIWEGIDVAEKLMLDYNVTLERMPCGRVSADQIPIFESILTLAMGARVVSWDMGGEMAEKFLAGKWCEGFTEQRRLNNERGYEVLQEIEARHFK